MSRRGVYGHIINISSMSGHRVVQGSGFYSATKHALRALTEGLRLEVLRDLRQYLLLVIGQDQPFKPCMPGDITLPSNRFIAGFCLGRVIPFIPKPSSHRVCV